MPPEVVRYGKEEEAAKGDRTKKVELEDGAWPGEREGLAEEARPEVGFAKGS